MGGCVSSYQQLTCALAIPGRACMRPGPVTTRQQPGLGREREREGERERKEGEEREREREREGERGREREKEGKGGWIKISSDY